MQAFETLKQVVDSPLYTEGLFDSNSTAGLIAAIWLQLKEVFPNDAECHFEFKNRKATCSWGVFKWERVHGGYGMFIMLGNEQPMFMSQWDICKLVSKIREGISFSEIKATT